MTMLNIFGSLVPQTLDADVVDNSPGVTMGVNWYSEQNGLVYGTRFYLGTRKYDGAQLTGGIFDIGTQALLAQKTITITSAMAIGWQSITFDTPLIVHRNQEYITAVYFPCLTSPDGKAHYPYTDNFFVGNTGVDNPPLHAQKNDLILDRRNGLFHYGASVLTFPTDNYLGGNYFADVDFSYYSAMPVYNSSTGKWVEHPVKRRVNGAWKY